MEKTKQTICQTCGSNIPEGYEYCFVHALEENDRSRARAYGESAVRNLIRSKRW